MKEYFQKLFLKEDPFTDILGQERTKQQLKSALLMDRHVIILGPPGIGKTTLAKNIARLLPPVASKTEKGKKITGMERFIRVQGSPDLTVEDLLGDIDPIKALKYGPTSIEAFTPGKIFRANRGILFFDEVNRCPEKLQNALLQVLEEGKATIASYEVDLPTNFIFIGTLNPHDSSTEKLSDVFLDRFDILYMDYPETEDIETEIVLQKGKKLVEFPQDILNYLIDFVRSLREDSNIEKKPSVRASISLYERAQANALLDKRNKVALKDLEACVVSVLSHRIHLKPSVKYLTATDEYVKKEFQRFMEDKPSEKEGDVP